MTLTRLARARMQSLRSERAVAEGGYRIVHAALGEPSADPSAGPGPVARTADVYIFGGIGEWLGVSSEDFIRDVAPLDVEQIVLHLNCPGGDAFEGIAIGNVLRHHRARVTVRVDGLAASAASIIAMAGDEIVMGIGSQMMIHDAWGWASGNAAEMGAAQRMLDSISEASAEVYASRAGGTAAQWREVMRTEAWYAPQEAVAAGLADRVAAVDEVGTAQGDQITPGASTWAGWWDVWDELSNPELHDLSAYAFAGRSAAPPPPIPGRGSASNPVATAAGAPRGRTPVPLTDEQRTTLRQTLGLPADATDAAITAAIAGTPDPADPASGPVVPPPADPATGTPITESMDAGVAAQLRADAALGRAAHERQVREDQEKLVRAAVKDGRIAPASESAWAQALAADRGDGVTQELAALKPGTIPVGAAIGHSGGRAEAGAEQRLQAGGNLYARRAGKKTTD